ncbi:zona pellucida-binding protein 1 isoform X2 [Chelonia mydas]|uniref:zona pellucida-binding protein 1 isoform X2 n=1 Tax=Chelonia mydas TaxID=8469 RepID=UPI001CAA374E|nr:zona pellucida-binding protein 1 isoform X2 [Chelonia mydas]
MELTAPPRPWAFLSLAAAALLLPEPAAGSPCFLDKTRLIKKGAARLKRENIDRIHDSVAFFETGGVTSIPDAPQISHQILGIEGSTIPVYVLINSKDLILKCLTQKLLKQRIIDPKYQWVGPIGLITKESQRFVLTDDGSLEIYNIHGSDSGSYICTVIYVHNNKHVTTEIRFMVYVYHKPGKSIHLSSEFKTETCETNAVTSFEKQLLENMENLIRDLQCEIRQWNSQCHAATDTMAILTHKLTFQFVVFPFALAFAEPCKSSKCENSTNYIKKAYTRIKQFFEVQNTESDHIHQIHYISGSLTVTCPPGRFSARYDTTCVLCASGSYNKKYGQTACKNCPKTQTSDRRGAKTERECHGTLQIWIVFLISSLGTSLILLTSWVIIHKCCRRTLAARYIEEAESELKTRLKTFANIASDAEIEEQRSKLRNPDRYERKNLPKYKVGFIEEESIGLLSNDGITETSTPVGSNPSPDRTWPSEVETSFEEGRSQGTLGGEEIHCVSKGLVSNPQKFNTMNHKLS